VSVLLTLLYQATLILAEICTTLHCAIQPNGVLSGIRKSATEWETNYSIAIKYDSVIQQQHYGIVEIESVLQYVTQSCHGEMNSNVSGVPAI
jgi:hypothetical protein